MSNRSEKKSQNDGLMKDGTSRRKRAGRAGRGAGMPRIMMAGGAVILLGAAWLYWPSGSSVPTGIGENQTVVTAPAPAAANADSPRSGEVDIQDQTPALTPEQPEAGAAAPPAAAETAAPEPQAARPAAAKPTPPPAAREAAPRIVPGENGPYAVQSGAFGAAANADKEAARLKDLGWDARVRAGNNSSGEMVFRVWIGYFQSREDAQAFISQNSGKLPGAITVHR